MKILVVAIALVAFHGPTGQRIDVNPAEVSSVREPQKGSTLLAEKVHCVIGLTNGKFISLGDDCAMVRRVLQGPCLLVCGDAPKR